MSEIARQQQIIQWILQDQKRMDMLLLAARCCERYDLTDWCLAAGFVRNLVWDQLHHYEQVTPLNDIDLIYFDPKNLQPDFDMELELHLHSQSGANWSVKNQARMHLRNNDKPYVNTCDAMSYWPEVETAVGICLVASEFKIIAPFGLDSLFEKTITLNPKRPKIDAFCQRIFDKGWLERWPSLEVIKH